MDKSEIPPTVTLPEKMPVGDAQVHTPNVEPTDRQYLAAASAIPGSQYGSRVWSNTALWALAIQREDIGRQLSLLSARNEQRLRSSRHATAAATIIAILSIGGVAFQTINLTRSAVPVANVTATRQDESHATTAKARAPATYGSVSSGDAQPAMANKHDVIPDVVQKPMARTVQNLPEAKYRPHSIPVKTSRWIAEPLYGEALRLALIVDRKRTKDLNDAQLREQANRDRK